MNLNKDQLRDLKKEIRYSACANSMFGHLTRFHGTVYDPYKNETYELVSCQKCGKSGHAYKTPGPKLTLRNLILNFFK